jgi:hypothetical protein
MASRTVATLSGSSTRRRIGHPTEYSDLRLRLLASQGVYQDNAQATLAALDQDPIGTWMDPPRPYLKFTQATAANKPKLLLAATPAAGNAVRFNKTDQTLLSVALNGAATIRQSDFRIQEHTVIGAFRAWEAPSATALVFAPQNSSNFYAGLASGNTLGHSYQNFNGGAPQQKTSATQQSSYTTNAWFVAMWRLRLVSGDYNTGVMEDYILSSTGVSRLQTRSGVDALGSNLNTSSGVWCLGGLTAGSSHISIDVAELNVYGAALADALITDLIAELKAQHGIT